MEHTLEIVLQSNKIQTLLHYNSLFHKVSPNNFSLICLNKTIDKTQSDNRYKAGLKILNVANFNLFRFCKIQSGKAEWKDEEVKKDVNYALNIWEKRIIAGNSFSCYNCARVVFEGFAKIHYPLLQILNEEKYRAVLKAFIDLEYDFKSFFKLSVFTDFSNLYLQIEDLLNLFNNNSRLFKNIERLEIAKENFGGQGESNKLFPKLSIFFDNKEVTNIHDSALIEVIDISKGIFMPGNSNCLPKQLKYLGVLTDNITISQGYKGYKQFLELVDKLDEVYDFNSNYAFIKATNLRTE